MRARDGLTTGMGRLLRGAAAGTATGLLAVFAHASAGGALPGWPAVAGPVLAIGTIASGLARVRLRPTALLAVLGLGQLAVHAVLTLGAGHGHAPDTAVMTFAHLAATAIVFAGLTGAEHTLFALVAALAARLPAGPTPLAVVGPVWTPCPPPPQQRPVSHALRPRIRGRRGPPPSTVRPLVITV
ncbi:MULTISPECIES: hypothetical protein [Prauserella salsuginis group]|uniref:Integral membrane protein n=1 Tax=Prauserella salsuginis TaxID=387889 RepID=A0ABW6G3M6_9PSEU|nr:MULTISPECIES: hypothetical protein [Prauserella salsuginis group]MCR3718671.1 hypothetical protein [Prauserella flava]MCR3733241.1 hypothetical protein [Prauserella salsuginis]